MENFFENQIGLFDNNTSHLMKEEGLYAYLISRHSAKGLHPSTVKGLTFFIVKKCFLKPKKIEQQLSYLDTFMLRLTQVIGNARIYGGNTLRYMSDKSDLIETCEDYLQNMQYWISIFGIDFFKEGEKKERLYMLRAPIDEDFFITCKGGSGIGTFCIDISIGFGEQRYPGVPRNEIWKMSIDTDPTGMRIVRSGGSMNSKHINAQQRTDMFDDFKNRYKMLPQRVLGALALYIAESEGKYPLRAVSLEGARKKSMSLVASSHVNFDYTKLFSGLGFEGQNANWLMAESFGKAISTIGTHEAGILDRVFHAFNEMKPTYDEGIDGLKLDVSHRAEELIDVFYTKHRGLNFKQPYGHISK